MIVVILDLDLTQFWWVGGAARDVGFWLWIWIWRVSVRFLNLRKIMK
jgi:hypothetical protein